MYGLIKQVQQRWTRFERHPAFRAWVLALLCSTAIWQAFPLTPVAVVSSEIHLAAMVEARDPATLSEADVTRYKLAYEAQDQGNFTAADAAMAQLDNRRLVGDLLANRYLGAGYQATNEELNRWLASYADHFQAAAISKLAITRGMDVAVIPVPPPLKGEGYAEHLGRSTMPDSWYRGLSLWREQNYSEAYPLFAAIGEDASLSDWQRSAGHYWAYRAASRSEDTETARTHLTQAMKFDTTFYGLLAARQSGTAIAFVQAPSVPERLRHHPQVIRAALFTQLDRNDDAEEELRHLYSHATENDRAALVSVAGEMQLPNLQVRLASMAHLTDAQARFANYPTPRFMVEAQRQVSPALLLAIVRNESGFREAKSSRAGAMGYIQMLPATARAVERQVGRANLESASISEDGSVLAERLNDPATSIRYGAEYLKLLAKQPMVGRSLIKVLAAYNAGQGTVASWQAASGDMNDPLLYIESIPYAETHNYIVQVMAQLWIYQTILGEKPDTLDAITRGQWPVFTLKT